MVTFDADYTKVKDGKVLYKKGETHAIHKTLAEKIKNTPGAKVHVKEIDQKKLIEEQKEALEKAKKEEKKNA